MRAAAPFGPFNAAMRKQADQIVITSRFRFTRDEGLETTLSNASPMSTAPDRYAVLGNPVAHSQSPFIHAEFARQTGQDLEYTRVLCAMDGFVEAVRAFADIGRARLQRHRALQVPVRRAGHAVTPRAALAQAANVLRFDADGWLADNTDGIGLVRDLAAQRRRRAAGRARAAHRRGRRGGRRAGPADRGAARTRCTWPTARRTRRAALVRRHAALAAAAAWRCPAAAWTTPAKAYDVVLNSSASSLGGAAVPVRDARAQARRAGGAT